MASPFESVPYLINGRPKRSLLGCVLFAQYAGFPGMLWGVAPAILAVFVAYGRMVLKPF